MVLITEMLEIVFHCTTERREIVEKLQAIYREEKGFCAYVVIEDQGKSKSEKYFFGIY